MILCCLMTLVIICNCTKRMATVSRQSHATPLPLAAKSLGLHILESTVFSIKSYLDYKWWQRSNDYKQPYMSSDYFFLPSRKCFEKSSPASAKYLNELPQAGKDLQAKALKTSSKDHWSKWEDYLFTAHYASVFHSDSLTCWFTFFFF